MTDYTEQTSNTADAVAAGVLIAEPTTFGNNELPQLATFVTPAGAQVHTVDVEEAIAKYRANPTRKTGTFRAHDAESFVAYMAKHGLGESEVWSDAQGQKIVGVINAHCGYQLADEEGGAGWGDHRVSYEVKLTDAWKAWTVLNGKLVTQVEFANHVEDRMVDIVVPDAADLLELAQSFEATTNVGFESAQVLSSGERQFVFREETTARAGQAGRLTIPKEFEISVQPFEGADRFNLVARLRYRLREGHLSIGYQLVRPEDILRAAFVSVSDAVKAGVAPVPVYLGVTG